MAALLAAGQLAGTSKLASMTLVACHASKFCIFGRIGWVRSVRHRHRYTGFVRFNLAVVEVDRYGHPAHSPIYRDKRCKSYKCTSDHLYQLPPSRNVSRGLTVAKSLIGPASSPLRNLAEPCLHDFGYWVAL